MPASDTWRLEWKQVVLIPVLAVCLGTSTACGPTSAAGFLSTLADFLQISSVVWQLGAAVIGTSAGFVVIRSLRRGSVSRWKRRTVAILVLVGASVGVGVSLAARSYGTELALCLLGVVICCVGQMMREARRRKDALEEIRSEAAAIPSLQLSRGSPDSAATTADRLLANAVSLARNSFAPLATDRDTVALLFLIDPIALTFRARVVVGGSPEFQIALRDRAFPFCDVKFVADTYNRHVEAARTAEGKIVSYDERLRRYRMDVSERTSGAGYAALRNRGFVFRRAHELCLMMRSEFLCELSDVNRERYEFRDLGLLPIVTDAGLVGVVSVGSIADCRLVFHKDTAMAVGTHLGAVLHQVAHNPNLGDHPAAVAVRHAVPARASRAFNRLVNRMTPRFSETIPEWIIAEAVREHSTLQGGWARRIDEASGVSKDAGGNK